LVARAVRRRKKWGKIGPPHSAKRRAWMRKIAKLAHRKRRRGRKRRR